jgi:ribonuclease P protein component
VVHADVFSLVFRNNAKGFSRLGIAIRKAVGNAPVRNRLKRWIREAFRRNANLRSLGLDIVVAVKRPGAGIGFHEIQDGFQLFLRRLP